MKKQAIIELIRKEIKTDRDVITTYHDTPAQDVDVVRYIQTQPVIDKINVQIKELEDFYSPFMIKSKKMWIQGQFSAFKDIIEWLS